MFGFQLPFKGMPQVSNLVFYARSTITDISGQTTGWKPSVRLGDTDMDNKYMSVCMPWLPKGASSRVNNNQQQLYDYTDTNRNRIQAGFRQPVVISGRCSNPSVAAAPFILSLWSVMVAVSSTDLQLQNEQRQLSVCAAAQKGKTALRQWNQLCGNKLGYLFFSFFLLLSCRCQARSRFAAASGSLWRQN